MIHVGKADAARQANKAGFTLKPRRNSTHWVSPGKRKSHIKMISFLSEFKHSENFIFLFITDQDDDEVAMTTADLCTPYNINTHINVFIMNVYIYYLMLFA
jgi:hypothetical protein